MSEPTETHRLTVHMPDGSTTGPALELTLPAGAGEWLAAALGAFQAHIRAAGDVPPDFTIVRREGER